jgi:hypothetical protein
MRVSVKHEDLIQLEKDLSAVPIRLYREGKRIVTENARDGGQTARRIAKYTARRHGRDYPMAITWDSASALVAFGGGAIKAAYGPDSSRPQGGMSFEEGSRHQPPHHDLANSLDLIRPKFHRDIDGLLGSLFEPGGR